MENTTLTSNNLTTDKSFNGTIWRPLNSDLNDELVFEVHKDQVAPFMSFVKELMCKVLELKVPLEVDVGKGENWEEAH